MTTVYLSDCCLPNPCPPSGLLVDGSDTFGFEGLGINGAVLSIDLAFAFQLCVISPTAATPAATPAAAPAAACTSNLFITTLTDCVLHLVCLVKQVPRHQRLERMDLRLLRPRTHLHFHQASPASMCSWRCRVLGQPYAHHGEVIDS